MRWAGRSLKSQGSQLRRPPSNTSPHFTGPSSFYYPLLFLWRSFKVYQRDEKWRAAGRALPSPCWGQQFTMLIETLTPPLIKAPLHSHRSHCVGFFCHYTVFLQCCRRRWCFRWWLFCGRRKIDSMELSFCQPLSLSCTNYTKLNRLSFICDNIQKRVSIKKLHLLPKNNWY